MGLTTDLRDWVASFGSRKKFKYSALSEDVSQDEAQIGGATTRAHRPKSVIRLTAVALLLAVVGTVAVNYTYAYGSRLFIYSH